MFWYARDGFGCGSHTIGCSIRCACLDDGKMTRWNRADLMGVLKDQLLPDWAAKKPAELKDTEQTQSEYPAMGDMTIK